MKIASVKTEVEYVKFGGGIDQLTPALTISPGAALSMHNYEPGVAGGARRIDGIERYSGKTSPSAGTYTYCTVTAVGATVVGNTITGATSGATGVVVVVSAGILAITKVTGTFTSSENYTVSAVVQGAMTSTPLVRGYPTGVDDATAMNLVADNYRADIAAPTGSGSIRGIVGLSGTVYAFRDNAGATACGIWKATTTGWSAITLYKIISFITGTSSSIADGASITQSVSGATATVKRQIIVSGTVAESTAAGYLVIDVTGGTFDATNVIQVGGVTKCTASSLATQIAIAAGGRYEFDVYNFTGFTSTRRIYGVDGVNKAFDFDGAVYIPITTGMTTDTPLHVLAHKKMLRLSFLGSLQSSSIGNPHAWSAVTGASEIGMGDTISGMIDQPGEVLVIATRNSTSQLLGSSVSDFNLQSLGPEVGAIPYTMQNLGVGFWLDDRGVIQITRTQAFGNFDNATVSRKVQTLIDDIRSVVTASAVYKARNQYRLYGSDGTGVVMTAVDGKYGPEFHFSTFAYPVNISCAWSGEDANGKDVVFLGASNGMVYQADRGSSFDGTAIEAYVRLAFNHSKSPSVIKQYRKATVEMTAVGYSPIRAHPDFSYGDPDSAQHILASTSVHNAVIQGAGGVYDDSYYETSYYDSKIVSAPEITIGGTGTNIGFVFYSNTDIDLGHTLTGLTFHYTPRRLQR